MTEDDAQLAAWIAYLFDHPEADRDWHFEDDAPFLDLGAEREAELIARMFETSGECLACFSDVQLDNGLWYLLQPHTSGHMECLVDEEVPLHKRERVLRSFVPFFEDVVARRCQGLLEIAGEASDGTLDGGAYMWWDLLGWLPANPADEDSRRLESVALKVMERILGLPHDACRASALHGLGH
ncbi:MAG: hypothetical protein ACYS26_10860 [Planctomycetota bacterium]|jgi:hypothetical protein